LLEAAALLKRLRIPFVLYVVGDVMGKPGDTETKASVFARIGHLGLNDVVAYQPFLPFNELIALALRSHVFAAPSITAADGDAEGTPFVLQQMMATGMPAIATDHSDIPYLFGEYKHLLVPERDSEAIAEVIQVYTEHPDRLVTDGMALRNRVSQAFDIRNCAARLSKLYDAAIDNRKV
jgi:colanic acid/amylovoran/stewartan biosynthesis glycosyltransferase WcaL/AmsK/CpsK